MAYADKNLTCRDCATTFVFTASEQDFYASRGLENEPGRCPDCRAARKAQRGGSYTSSDSSRGGYGGPREMFAAVCAECGKDAQVPFQPRDDRPVYCSDCYSAQRASNGSGRRSGAGGRSRSW